MYKRNAYFPSKQTDAQNCTHWPCPGRPHGTVSSSSPSFLCGVRAIRPAHCLENCVFKLHRTIVGKYVSSECNEEELGLSYGSEREDGNADNNNNKPRILS